MQAQQRLGARLPPSYREDLVAQGRQPTTIARKLNVLRRIYAAAVAAGLRTDNPAIGIRAPRDRRAPEDFGYLSEVELALLFRAVPHDDKLKHLCDRALLGLLGLEALRRVQAGNEASAAVAPVLARLGVLRLIGYIKGGGSCQCTARLDAPGGAHRH